MTTEIKTEVFYGTLNVCCHSVEFYYEIDLEDLTDSERCTLTEDAETRSRAMISENCSSGELCCILIRNGSNDQEVFGWWTISKN